jgi:hypothetical protein
MSSTTCVPLTRGVTTKPLLRLRYSVTAPANGRCPPRAAAAVAQLLQVPGTGSHEQLVVLAGERPALLQERLEHRNDLRGRPVLQVDDFQ